MESYVRLLKENSDIEVVGFGQSPIFKMANKYIWDYLCLTNVKALLTALHSIQCKCFNRYGYNLLINLTLVNFLVNIYQNIIGELMAYTKDELNN